MSNLAQSQLLLWIKAQEQAGVTDSSGVFTLDRGKAFAKMGSSALPFEYAWVLKVVQAAVSQGSELRVAQSSTETVFRWEAPSWGHGELEVALLEKVSNANRSLSHFVDGLRALAMTGLPFSLGYGGGEIAFWTGQGFELASAANPMGDMVLTVSHLKVGETEKRFSLSDSPDRARYVGIGSALSQHAHWSPVSITLDKRVVSNVANDPRFGASHEVHPLYFMPFDPNPAVPSWVYHARFSKRESMMVVFTGKDSNLQEDIRFGGEPVSAVAMICAVTRFEKGSGGIFVHSSWKPALRHSEFVWVADGVEVLREQLELPTLPTPLLVACSADGLETDLSGMLPRDTEERHRRRDRVMRGVTKAVAGRTFETESGTPMGVFAGKVTLTLGVMLAPYMPWLALPTMAAGGVLMGANPYKKLQRLMDQGLLDLQRMLLEFWGKSRDES